MLADTFVAGLVKAKPGGRTFCKNVREDRKRMEIVVKRSGCLSRSSWISGDDGLNDKGDRGPGLGPNPNGVLHLAEAFWRARCFCSA
jgi:hypothetical protein